MNSGWLVNLGSGEKTLQNKYEYSCLNIDIRPLPGVDVVSDATTLPFKDGSVSYVYAHDIIEHFPIRKTGSLLSEWNRILQPDGIIEIKCPDIRAICERYMKGKNSTELTSWLLYGAQDYELNFHCVGFDREWLSEIMKKHEFEPFFHQRLEKTNMILKARKKLGEERKQEKSERRKGLFRKALKFASRKGDKLKLTRK